VIRIVAALALAAAPLAASLAQPVHTGGMATRSVSRYLALERDTQALPSRLAPDFEYRTAASAEVRDARAWERAQPRSTPRIRDLTVREEGDLAIVSFLADSGGRTHFIVDVWRGETLLSRYSARAADAPRAPSRPDGRE
jgi:hypothetical protein